MAATEPLKFQLAHEISRIPDDNKRTNLCSVHGIKPRSRFVDWYLVLRVEENADTDCIKKQYRKLALLLHPDKNHHPKADIAFKLVSEAYDCLSDKAKRRAFNLDRWRRKNFVYCEYCNCTLFNTSSDLPYRQTNRKINEPHLTRHPNTPTILKDLRRRMEEEARVIEHCLRVNRKTSNGYAIFSPSSYKNQGYPHQQSRDYKGLENVVCFGRGSVEGFSRRVKCETPIFELRADCIPLNVKST